MSIDVLSTEVQQTVLGYLDFISLLAIKNTNTYWRDLVDNSLSKPGVILPARIRLLSLYQELHLRPSFFASRQDTVPEFQPFWRAEYLSTLQRQISECAPNSKVRIPTEFELWILEWPEYDVIGHIWPFLEDNDSTHLLHCLDAGKRLSWTFEEELVGLYVGYYGCQTYATLFFDCGEERDGMVLTWDICELAEIEDWEGEDWEEDDNLAGCWTEWLRRELRKDEGWL